MQKRTWLAISTIMAGMIALFTPSAEAAPSGCNRVAPADRALCREVRAQHAYGWTDRQGTPQNWIPNGRILLKEITGQGLTPAEVHDALTGARRSYRAFVTDVSFDLDKIARICGHKNGSGSVKYVRGDDGHYYTFRLVSCD